MLIRAEMALTADGWVAGCIVEIGTDGRISAVTTGAGKADLAVDALLPAPGNLHSHAFQRAMAGLTEARGPDPTDSFWTWRRLMYDFLDRLTPDDVQAIAAFQQMEALEAGFGAMGEFHYLHHAPGGVAYDDPAEMAARICAAAAETGIGLTMLPVLYAQGGCDGRPLAGGQLRFGNDVDAFARLLDASAGHVAALPDDCRTGVAPHSLRAVSAGDLQRAAALRPGDPVHIHAAEQVAEVDEVVAALGARPVEYLLDQGADGRWCLIHSTQMTGAETRALAASGAVAGLCPITESSLGDGIFDGARYLASGGAFGVGSDSNIQLSLTGELRTFEYSQRLRDRARAVLATPDRSTGRVLWEGAAAGAARALGRGSGRIEVGARADLVGVSCAAPDLEGIRGDRLLDALIFGTPGAAVAEVWSGGRHVVKDGRHIARDTITTRYRAAVLRLRVS